jgi:tripartite-type tricarboxylate transporter receptor subunit TctC
MRSGTISIARAVFLFHFGWLALTAAAQTQYPSRMVRAIVPYTPGSSADLIARNLGPRLSEGWKVPFVVDNRAGASGIIGVQAVVGAPGDGYTVLIMADNFASAASVRRSSYDPVNDLDPVILLARGDYALMASASFPAKSVEELVVAARANPGKIYYASPGSGLPAHLMMEVFKSTMGIDLVHVPYKNNAAAVTDLIGGQVSLMFASLGVALPLAEGGRIRILAAGAAKRAARTPEVPSFIESGVRDFKVGTWFAMLVPKGTPREVRAKLYADVAALLKEPAVAELMLKQGMTPAGGTPEELHDLIRSDFERWNRIVREANIKAD